MIEQKRHILEALLAGDHKGSSKRVAELLDAGIPVKQIYEEYIKPALYDVGRLWEQNKISVASEHLASAITESLLNEIYLRLETAKNTGKTVIVTCLENEHHQIGARMVSDIFEMQGWNVLFLGANTPKYDLVNYIHLVKPDLVAISLSIFFNLPTLEATLDLVSEKFPEMPVLVGGQAFNNGGKEQLVKYKFVTYLSDLDSIETFLKN